MYVYESICGDAFDEEVDEMYDQLEENGYRVDEEYFEHAQEFNGGVPVAKYFPQGQIERLLNFSDTYSPAGAKFKDLNANYIKHLLKERVPENVFPFASMPHGAFLCFEYSEAELPKVVMWNNEAYDQEFVLISKTFGEFLGMLSETPYA